MRKGKGRGGNVGKKTDLFEFPILSFELVIFLAVLPRRVFRIMGRGRSERGDGGWAHDDVSVYGGRRGQHWGGPAGHW